MEMPKELKGLLDAAGSEEEKKRIFREYLEKEISEMSDEELDSVSGGSVLPPIGNTEEDKYKDFANLCISHFKDDICQAYLL